MTLDFNKLPNELIKMLISYLDIRSAQNVALTSKKMHELTMERLWSKPRYTKDERDLEFLHQISHFPICVLHTRDFDCNWLEILGLVPQLQLLHVDTRLSYFVRIETLRYLRLLKVPLIVYTEALEIPENFDQLLDSLAPIHVEKFILNHESKFYNDENRQRTITIAEFRKLSEKVNVAEVNSMCLQINDENVLDFINILASIQNCRVLLSNIDLTLYKFKIRDLELMIQNNIKIVYIESNAIDIKEGPVVMEYFKAMEKMTYLEEFKFYIEEFSDPFMLPLDFFTKLPMKYISTNNFRNEEGKIGDIVNIANEVFE